jgi:hypothetical protein
MQDPFATRIPLLHRLATLCSADIDEKELSADFRSLLELEKRDTK